MSDIQMPKGTEVRHISPRTATKYCPEGREDNTTARIRNYCPEIGEGAVMLDRDLHGCLYWNVEELEPAQ